jgi:hypothetical protein
MKSLIITILATFAIQVGVITLGVTAQSAHAMPTCQYEDSPGPCKWDATKQGNGKGTSFVNDDARHPKYLP